MNKKIKFTVLGLVIAGFALLAFHYLSTTNIAVLNPKGPVAAKERNLMVFTVALVSIVVVPVYVLTVVFAWRYRESNHKAKYSPKLDGGRGAELLWWFIPGVIILILSVATWRSSHQLDPARPLVSSAQPMTVQVVAMNWKWLFIYPEQNIASVNFVQFPVNRPVDFQITSDASMNSFWIPQLGGQIYAMAGMSTQLHLEASEAGSYNGSSANISGRGFAGMSFMADATSQNEFDRWVKAVRRSADPLGLAQYNNLAKQSTNNPIAYYSSTMPGLFGNVMDRYMMPGMGSYIQ